VHQQNIDVPDQNEIVDRAGVGDDEVHASGPSAFGEIVMLTPAVQKGREVGYFFPHIVNCGVHPNIMSLQKPVELVTCAET